MKITLATNERPMDYTATSDNGYTIELSGEGRAMSPMYAVLSAVAGCSTIDVELILKRMRQDVVKIEVEAEGTRRDETPKVFTHIKLHYIIYGEVKEKKVVQAIEMSLADYCSVALMLKDEIEVTYTYEVREA